MPLAKKIPAIFIESPTAVVFGKTAGIPSENDLIFRSSSQIVVVFLPQEQQKVVIKKNAKQVIW
jgi:hypothetical protein